MNIKQNIYPETLFQLILDVLGKSSRFLHLEGVQPFLMSFDGKEYYVYVKNLSSAYFKDRPDTTRAQLPIKDEFDKIKTSSIPFIFLGYDQDNDVLVCWNYHIAKERLNEKKSVSFYSRQFFQEEVTSGELLRKTLKNGDEPILFKRKDLELFFSEIDSLFPLQNELPKIGALFDYILDTEESDSKPTLSPVVVNGKILKITEPELIEKLKPIIEANHSFEAMKVAEQYYKGLYSGMKPKDWLALIKEVDCNNSETPQNGQTSNIAAEPLNKYQTKKSYQDDFIEFMQNSGLSNKSINNYLVALSGRICIGIKKYIDSELEDIFLIDNASLLSDWYSRLFKTPEFTLLDSTGKNMYSCALKKYIQYVEFNGNIIPNQKIEPFATHETSKSNELRFVEYLLTKGLSENSAKYYANAMGGKVADCIRDHVDSNLHNIYSIRDYNTVFDWSLSLYRTPEFKELDNKGNRQYSCALKHYLEYLYSTNSDDVFQNDFEDAFEDFEYQLNKKKSYILRVTYPNGHIVEERKVSKTLIDVVISTGAERVQSLGIMLNGTNLVSKTILPRYAASQKPIGNNLYVMTCCDTNTKQKIIEQISESFNLNLKVEKIPIK